MSESGFERFAVVRVRGGLQVVQNARTRKLKALKFLLAVKLRRGFLALSGVSLGCLAGFDLRLYVFTFPSTCHTYILTQKPHAG